MTSIIKKNRPWGIILALSLLSIFLGSCQGNDPADYATRLCNCYNPESEAAQQLRAGQLSSSDYELKMVTCMGEDDPLEALKDDEAALKEFKISFYKALQKKCPKIAHNLGY